MTDPKTTPAAPEAPAPLQQPSQDPRLVAQVPMDADTASREVKSVGVGGGVSGLDRTCVRRSVVPTRGS